MSNCQSLWFLWFWRNYWNLCESAQIQVEMFIFNPLLLPYHHNVRSIKTVKSLCYKGSNLIFFHSHSNIFNYHCYLTEQINASCARGECCTHTSMQSAISSLVSPSKTFASFYLITLLWHFMKCLPLPKKCSWKSPAKARCDSIKIHVLSHLLLL